MDPYNNVTQYQQQPRLHRLSPPSPRGGKTRDPRNQVVSTIEYWTPQLQTLSERLRFVLFLCKNWRVWGPILSLRQIFIKLRMFT